MPWAWIEFPTKYYKKERKKWNKSQLHQTNVIYAGNVERGSDLGFLSNFVVVVVVVVVAFVQYRRGLNVLTCQKKTLHTGYDSFHKRTTTIPSRWEMPHIENEPKSDAKPNRIGTILFERISSHTATHLLIPFSGTESNSHQWNWFSFPRLLSIPIPA